MSQSPSPPTAPTAPINFSDFESLILRLGTPYAHLASSISYPNDIARSTASLTQADQELVNSGLHDVERLLDAVSSAEGQIDTLLAFVSIQKANLQATRARYQALVAPIRRLPAEVLQEIFIFVRELEGQERRAPSVVAQVNQYWRRVALATPQLWTSILLSFSFNTQNVVRRVEELETRMKRTGGRPVSLTVFVWVMWGPVLPLGEEDKLRDFTPAATALAKAILPHSPRLRSLTIRIRERAILGPFFDIWETSAALDLTNLKELNLKCDVPPSIPRLNMASAIQRICDRAHNLHILTILQFDHQEVLKLPLGSLKVLRCPLNPATATAIFASATPHLQLLEVECNSYHRVVATELPIPSSPYPPLPNLTTLVIGRLPPPSVAAFPPLPSLRHLIMNNTPIIFSEDSCVLSMVQAWGSSLRYIALPLRMSSDTVEQVLHLLPNLEAINIPDTEYLVEPILDPDFDPTSMPKRLYHVEVGLEDWATQGADLSDIKLFLERAIVGSIPSLATLTLFLTSGAENDYFEIIQNLVEDENPAFSNLGISLSVKDTGNSFNVIHQSQYLETAGVTQWYPVA